MQRVSILNKQLVIKSKIKNLQPKSEYFTAKKVQVLNFHDFHLYKSLN